MPDSTSRQISSPHELVDALTFANVYFLKFSAERFLGNEPDSFSIQIEPYHVVGDDRIDYLFVVTCDVTGADEEAVAVIKISAIATFDVATDVDTSKLAMEFVEFVGGEVALFAAYPYLREAIQSHASRLGMPNITLDLLKRNEPVPENISIAARPEGPE